ncbi:hypothetical protein DFH07DRAFT_850931 [Mycena maculata]|uniref:Uncharacterized protein n=1 Tax=Mycena maculata TaxID=230809 RepID=A0AAD7MRF4_9AGAR|nr:hypothetical protein DFH07DRAFT_850931 [Mycena maculata]
MWARLVSYQPSALLVSSAASHVLIAPPHLPSSDYGLATTSPLTSVPTASFPHSSPSPAYAGNAARSLTARPRVKKVPDGRPRTVGAMRARLVSSFHSPCDELRGGHPGNEGGIEARCRRGRYDDPVDAVLWRARGRDVQGARLRGPGRRGAGGCDAGAARLSHPRLALADTAPRSRAVHCACLRGAPERPMPSAGVHGEETFTAQRLSRRRSSCAVRSAHIHPPTPHLDPGCPLRMPSVSRLGRTRGRRVALVIEQKDDACLAKARRPFGAGPARGSPSAQALTTGNTPTRATRSGVVAPTRDAQGVSFVTGSSRPTHDAVRRTRLAPSIREPKNTLKKLLLWV